jgi:hypothetical protein
MKIAWYICPSPRSRHAWSVTTFVVLQYVIKIGTYCSPFMMSRAICNVQSRTTISNAWLGVNRRILLALFSFLFSLYNIAAINRGMGAKSA